MPDHVGILVAHRMIDLIAHTIRYIIPMINNMKNNLSIIIHSTTYLIFPHRNNLFNLRDQGRNDVLRHIPYNQVVDTHIVVDELVAHTGTLREYAVNMGYTT